ncbi:hypothetical protein HLV39_14345 [Marinobacter adhaerens]|uniref:Big-1 domain-containing protein n=1 Tax=Marinobacter adhaerens TaxID=1033846 RepID=A0A851HUJ3_9GAMM|nr:hypothetical protein [Marinobacter adhaerens]NWN92673.1 hypothetical protein [Marinobacter adhaerens]
MSGKFLARASALSLAVILAACGGDDDSTPIVNVNPDSGGANQNGSTETGGETSQEDIDLELGTGSNDSFQSGAISLTASDLSSGGTTRLEFNVVNTINGNAIYSGEETTVTLSSQCETAKLDSPLTTTSGKISTSYTAGCSGDDIITARLNNGASATALLSVASQEVGALEFVSVTPPAIATIGSADSARASVSRVVFKLVDKNGDPVIDEEVDFELSSGIGGASLTEASAPTSSDGTAQTRVNAGTVASVVSVTATYELDSGEIIQTTSDPISISAAIPDTDSFSISVEANFLPNARFYDGQNVGITIRAADRNNNKINDSIVNFVTSGGAIANECELTKGVCSLDWVSQDPRPSDTGVVAILARSVGEESFRDLNSDGIYTAGVDLFIPDEHDSSEAFLDRNNNNTRDSNEEFFDYNQDGIFNDANGIYDGTACSKESEDAGQCTKNVSEIFELAHIYLASDLISINPLGAEPFSPGSICFSISGDFTDPESGGTIQGPPPGNTTVSFETTNGTILGDSSFDTTTSYRTTPVTQCVTIEADDTSDSGTLTVEVLPPAPYGGPKFVERYTITD